MPNLDIGNLITLLTLLLTIILGISDIKRRRAEAAKLQSESKLSNASADTQIMSQIKQASIDLMNEIRKENEELHIENKELKEQISYYKGILRQHRITFPNYETRKLQMTEEARRKLEAEYKDDNTTR